MKKRHPCQKQKQRNHLEDVALWQHKYIHLHVLLKKPRVHFTDPFHHYLM